MRAAIEDGKAATKLLDAAHDFDEKTQPDIPAGAIKIGSASGRFPPWGAVLVAVTGIVAYVVIRLLAK